VQTAQGTGNVVAHLPEAERPLIQRKLRAAWANPDPDTALRELTALARALEKKRPGAAASLREGLADTLTVNRLGVTGSLLKTVESTNPAESMIEIGRHHSRRVKRWQHGEMALRWDRRRNARRRDPVPPRRGLPAAPPTAGRPRRSNRRPTRRPAPRRHRVAG
jgi:transposase-like protein